MPISNVTMDEKWIKMNLSRDRSHRNHWTWWAESKPNQNPEIFPAARVGAPYSTETLWTQLSSIIFYSLCQMSKLNIFTPSLLHYCIAYVCVWCVFWSGKGWWQWLRNLNPDSNREVIYHWEILEFEMNAMTDETLGVPLGEVMNMPFVWEEEGYLVIRRAYYIGDHWGLTKPISSFSWACN